MASVMGVSGLISEAQLGLTLPHEHLFTNLSFYWSGEAPEVALRDFYDQPVSRFIRQEVLQAPWAFKDNTILDSLLNSIDETNSFLRAGGKTIVDMSPTPAMGRNPNGLLTISIETGANVIMSAGRYSEPSMEDADKKRDIDDLVKDFMSEFVDGVGETAIHPGLLKVGFVDRIDKASEINSLRAAGRVQKRVGCALSVHPHIWAPDSNLILDILEEEGCDLHKVILCHQDYLGRQVEYLSSLVGRGVFIEFDTFGSGLINDRMWQMEESTKIKNVKEQIQIGNASHVLISGDMCLKVMLSKWGGKGLVNIPQYTLPAMQAAGIAEEFIQMIVIENPKKALCH
jgi:phosphotriesterase-related protein